LELATVLLEDAFEVAVPEVLGAGVDELETATVLPEFVFATEVLLPVLSALFVSEDFVLLERAGTVFTDELAASEALLADPVEVFVLGLACECATFGAASGCFEFSAVVEDATEFFNSVDAGMVVVPERETPADSPWGIGAATMAGFAESVLLGFATGFAFTLEALFARFFARAAATTDCRSSCPGCVSPPLELFSSASGRLGIALAST
jgi:hypothetical protein